MIDDQCNRHLAHKNICNTLQLGVWYMFFLISQVCVFYSNISPAATSGILKE